MKLFRKEEMQSLEREAAGAGFPEALLMDRAGEALALEAERRLAPVWGKRAVVLCGRGNNGGDGFVCAAHLARMGMECAVVTVLGPPETDLAKSALAALPGTVPVISYRERREEAEALVRSAHLILDCLFGFGFRGELPPEAANILETANGSGGFRLAADLPSGAACGTGRVSPGTFRADVTVCFTGKKAACAAYPAREFCGETVICQVGVPAALTEQAETCFFETDEEFVRPWLREPGVQSNKGDLGKLLLVCGSYGMAGACVMAARGALRSGAGLLRIAADERVYPILAQAVPEAVFLPLNWETRRAESEKKLREALASATACILGCGLGELAETACPVVFDSCRVPLIVDADGLNFAARHPGTLQKAAAPLILTPHPGEAARLTGRPVPEIQSARLETALSLAAETGAVAVLKGAGTVTASPVGRAAVNPTGNPGMAKGGSGDVLAGIIGSLAAQSVPPFEAAAAGVYVHGLAGDLCAKRLGTRAMLPTDLISCLPEAFRSLSPSL